MYEAEESDWSPICCQLILTVEGKGTLKCTTENDIYPLKYHPSVIWNPQTVYGNDKEMVIWSF
jgi:hypothetical protein